MTNFRKEDFIDLTNAIVSVVVVGSFIVWTIKTLFIN